MEERNTCPLLSSREPSTLTFANGYQRRVRIKGTYLKKSALAMGASNAAMKSE